MVFNLTQIVGSFECKEYLDATNVYTIVHQQVPTLFDFMTKNFVTESLIRVYHKGRLRENLMSPKGQAILVTSI